VAERYHFKREDVGTDVLAYLLDKQECQEAFGEFLKEVGWPHSLARFSVQPRKKDDSRVPDLKVMDAVGSCRMIIENKFGAKPTEAQRTEYLDILNDPEGMLLFIVPEHRRQFIWENLLKGYEGAKLSFGDVPGKRFIKGSPKGYLAVTSWEKFHESFSKHYKSHNGEEREIAVFLEQLRRLGAVVKRKEIRLTGDFQDNREIAAEVYNYVRLAERFIVELDENGLFIPIDRPSIEEVGAGFNGRYGKLGGFKAWIGFDARVWSKEGQSPIWVELDEPEEIHRLPGILDSSRVRISYFALDDELDDEVVIPVDLAANLSQDELLENMVSQVREIREVLSRAATA
jgi:hypothetical protein